MATLAVQNIVKTGVVPTLAAAAGGGDVFLSGYRPRTFFHAKNASGAPITVTVVSVDPCDQGDEHNLAVVVAAGAEKLIGPLPRRRFGNAVTGLVSVTYSGVTSLTVGAFAVGD